MPNRGRKSNRINDLELDPERLGEASDDEDFDPRASHASPSKSKSRNTKSRTHATPKKVKPKRRRNDYSDDDEEDLGRGSWSASSASEVAFEMTAAGRPSRGATRSGKPSYAETSESESAEFSEDEDEEEVVVKPKTTSRKGGKQPTKQTPKKTVATRRSRRQQLTEDEEDDEEEEEAQHRNGTRHIITSDEDETAAQKPQKLVVRLHINPKKLADMTRTNSRPGTAVSQTRRSSRLASLPPENTAEDLPVRTRRPSREPSASPTGRARRSRSTSARPTTAGKGPVSYSQGRVRPATRAASRESSQAGSAPPEVRREEVQTIVVKEVIDPHAMSKITEESTQSTSKPTSAANLTNGEVSGEKTDATFQPNSTSNDDSLEVHVTQRETTGLYINPDLTQDQETPGRKMTRGALAAKKEIVETGILPDDDAIEEQENQMDVDDDDDEPITLGRRRTTRSAVRAQTRDETPTDSPRKTRKSSRRASQKQSDDDYEEEEEEEEEEAGSSDSDQAEARDDNDDDEGAASQRPRRSQRKRKLSDGFSAIDQDELAQEAHELRQTRKKSRHDSRNQEPASGPSLRRNRGQVDYRIWRPEDLNVPEDDGTPPPPTGGARNGRNKGSSGQRPLFNTFGPFGGIGQERSILNSDRGFGFNDSDSSDDDIQMMPAGGIDGPGHINTSGKRDSISRAGGIGQHGTPADMGKITPATKQNLADADPIGIDPNVDFSKVGGLVEHINQLKEMVALPLMYPEIFQALGITPPRGVLFHGPPGTGKTLLARALANSCSANGKQITFYMRKGADILSKWVGEAERQVRLLFADARKNAPSIIFFDEIDGLAPVRSSKQDQIHASIVSTLLALMDGMDGRGQVIVIGATNRPDSIDPALRRPGRFDREFYFPLPDKTARKAILDIHTTGWTPPLSDSFKNELASITKGYGGADLRALCTEAALNAVQRKYPQIYKDTDKKFLIDPKSIEVTARDFMISADKIVPSSERSSTSGAAPLPEHIVPLLNPALETIRAKIQAVFPDKKKQSALQEAEYEPYTDPDGGFGREKMLKDFENTRVFKPRILIHGQNGMGQGYLGAAILHQFEGVHVQTVNLPVLMGDPAKNAEATMIQIFTELRRHKPSVLYIPDLENWFNAVSPEIWNTFLHLIGSIGSSERILVLGIASADIAKINAYVIRELFGYTRKCRIHIEKPDEGQRDQFFQRVIGHVKKSPKDFPDPTMRPKRIIEQLEIAPPPQPKEPTKEEVRAQKQNDKYYAHQLKVRLMPIIELLKGKYKRFRRPFIPAERLKALYPSSEDDEVVTSDIRPEPDVRRVKDDQGVEMVLDVLKNRKFYNMELETVETRVFNGYYSIPAQFLEDITYIALDCQASGERPAMLLSSEMKTNVEISIFDMEKENPGLVELWHAAYKRNVERARKREAANLRTILGSAQTNRVTDQTQTPRDPNSVGIVKKVFNVGTPLTPLMMGQKQMMPPLIEERSSLSNGYIASSEMGHVNSKDHEGDSNMSGTAPNESDKSSTFQTAVQGQTQQGSALVPPPITTSTSQLAVNNSTINTQSGNVTQKSGTRYSSVVGISSTQRGFEENTADLSTTTSGKKTSSDINSQHRLSDQSHATNSGSNQETPPARPVGFVSDITAGSVIRYTHLAHSSTVTGYDVPVVFGDSQLPDTQPVASSEGSAQSQFVSGVLHGLSTQATAGNFSNSSQQSPVVPFPTRVPAKANNLPVQSSAPPVLRRPPSPDPPLELNDEDLRVFHRGLIEKTEGFTIEQLEQVNAAIMDLVWKHRASWDRNEILIEAKEVLRDVFEDVEAMVKFSKVDVGVGKRRGMMGEEEISYGDILSSDLVEGG